MPQITKVTSQKKRKDRYNIYIDDGKGEKYAFSVDEEVLLKFNLKKGKDIDEFDLADIQYYDDIQKAFTYALNYLSHRMRSELEIRSYLKKKEIDDPIIQEAVYKLYNYKYLDDLAFAQAFVRTQINGGNKGPLTIKLELKEKGINEKIIEQALLQYPFEIQEEHARKLAEKSIAKEKGISERALKQKLEQTLLRKGFSMEAITESLQNVSLEKGDDEEWYSLCHQAEKAHRRLQKYTGFEYEQRMKQALFRKGFPIDSIERYLAEKKELS
ncbi:recombination regulator RecX [Peribacillus cavernae]|uniref:Regulatory protein RecX n=1 Tax=Peribacillus cavernae TaxID=1674310 RepID=A0A3S0VEA7_9BACI|nr:recombination regulator RecX [Peribacillus cavernae]MDQ0220862.1 regulatory protein [Peribacillus cavernae]RUQ24868.1 recombination regulator RecX [Peribacillus cavernae]